MRRKYKKKYYISFLLTCVPDVIYFALGLLLYIFAGKRILWNYCMIIELWNGSFIYKRFFSKYNGGVFGRCIWYREGIIGDEVVDTRVERHEGYHVEQYEVFTYVGFFLCFATYIVESNMLLSLAIWIGLSPLSVLSGFLVAHLRGLSLYQGSMHEKSAYALQDEYHLGGK
jgi:hypothetical protein